MKKLYDYSNWLVATAIVCIVLVVVGATGKVWFLPSLLTAIGVAVRLKYGTTGSAQQQSKN